MTILNVYIPNQKLWKVDFIMWIITTVSQIMLMQTQLEEPKKQY